MKKRFFTVMLGSLAAIWASVFLVVIVLSMIIGSVSLLFNDEPEHIDDKSILYINLDKRLEDVNPSFDYKEAVTDLVYGSEASPVLLLRNAVDAIRAAETDDRIKGIYIDADPISGGAASLQALHDALLHFKENSGKWIVAYGDQISQGAYYLSAMADELYINPEGIVDIFGLVSVTPYFKGMFEKLGIGVQVFKVGTFKSAVEPYILDSMSVADRRQTEQYMNVIWNNISQSMARERRLTQAAINNAADSMLCTVSPAKLVEMGFVDNTLYRHQVEDNLRSKMGIDAKDKLPFVNIENYARAVNQEKTKKSKDKIAVLYAVGDISDSGNKGVTIDNTVPTILKLAQNDDVKALVLRVNSPGGSAFASEQIWEALEQFKAAGKPFYVSMGDYAASGGYYISCGADRIYSSPSTLTGSIGIFGIIFNEGGLYKKFLDVNVSAVTTNKNQDLTGIFPLNSFQCSAMQNMVERGYETFVNRVAQGRGLSPDSVKVIAEGRVWAGETALSFGLVDELGSLDKTIEDIAAKADLSDYELDIYPRPKDSFWDFFEKMSSDFSASMMRRALGDRGYELYQKTESLREMESVQCRMEDRFVTL